MPVELRKRKAPAAPPPELPAKKKQSKVAKVVEKVKEAVKPKPRGRPPKRTRGPRAAPAEESAEESAESSPEAPAANGLPVTGKPQVGDIISLDGFGGEVETNDGVKTTLKALVDESKAGVVLFTYPKASTPGCTTQVCLFRDSYGPLTAGGLTIFGLSTDSPKANTTFRTKQNLPYPLLCDPSATLIGAIGLKKAPKGTTRGVFAVDKTGKVLVAEPGGPAATLAAVKRLVEELAGPEEAEKVEGVVPVEEEAEEKLEEKPVAAAPVAEEKPVTEEPVVETKDLEMTDAPVPAPAANGEVKGAEVAPVVPEVAVEKKAE